MRSKEQADARREEMRAGAQALLNHPRPDGQVRVIHMETPALQEDTDAGS